MLRFPRPAAREASVPALVIGTGSSGRSLAHALLAGGHGLRPIGFLAGGTGMVEGLPLLGLPADLAEIAAREGAGAAVVAEPGMPRDQLTEIAVGAWAAGLDLRWLPSGSDPSDLRELRLSGLLGRAEIGVSGARLRRLVTGRRVLVTGAAGQIGTVLSAVLTRLRPERLWLQDDEVAAPPDDRWIRADLADPDAADRLLDQTRPELVVHAAGRSGLATLEAEPCAAVTANVRATHRLVDSAVRHGTARFVLVSTDKAADPASVLGATKRLAEVVTQTAAGGPTRFAAVRLGNLLGLPGSLPGVLAGRMARNEAVTITHPEVARRFMSGGEAAGAVLEGAALAEEAETFALDVGEAVPVVDVLQRYAEQFGLPEVTIRFIGLGPGEKLAERAFAAGERRVRTAHPGIWATLRPPLPGGLAGVLEELYEAAEAGDDASVRLLLRRLLPEYRPVRRGAPRCESP